MFGTNASVNNTRAKVSAFTFGHSTTATGSTSNSPSITTPKASTGVFGTGNTSSFGAFGSTFPATSTPGPSTPKAGFGATPTNVSLPTTTTGTALPTFSAFCEKDPSNPRTILQYQMMTAMPAYKDSSLEELRVQDYQQKQKTAGLFGQTSFGTPASSTTNLFGGGTPGTSGALGKQQSTPGTTAFEQPKSSFFGQPTDHVKQGRLEEFMRKFLLGEGLVNIQFHLFSARSSSKGRVVKPRALCSNNILLVNGSKYFLDLLSSDIDPADTSLSDLVDESEVPSDCGVDDYGYESDSDLDECDEPTPETPRSQSTTSSFCNIGADDKLEDESQTFVVSTEDEESSVHKETLGGQALAGATIPLRSSAGRHVLVKDAAFQTWYALLNYLSTGQISFLPTSSTSPGGKRRASSGPASSLDQPKCSAKSMYRLASKVGLDHLGSEALAHIKNSLTEDNILKEISSSLLPKHPQLLEMELDVLYSLIATPPVVAHFPALLRRIANKELPHGADIMQEMHSRFLKALYPFSSAFGAPSASVGPLTPTTTEQNNAVEEGSTLPMDPKDAAGALSENVQMAPSATTAHEVPKGRSGRNKRR